MNKKEETKKKKLVKKQNINKLNPMKTPVINEQITTSGAQTAIFS